MRKTKHIYRVRFDPKCSTCVKFTHADRNCQSLTADHSVIRATKRPLLADTERTYYIRFAWSISRGQLDNSSIRLEHSREWRPLMRGELIEAKDANAVALFVPRRFSLILCLSLSLYLPLSLSFLASRHRCENLKPRGRELIEERPSDKRVINTSFVSKLKTLWVSQPFVKLPRFNTLSTADCSSLSLSLSCRAIISE